MILTLFACKNENIKPIENKLYSEWVNYFDEDNFETHYGISSIVSDNHENIYCSGWARRNNFTIDIDGIFWLNKDLGAINYIEPLNFSIIDESLIKTTQGEKQIWHNNSILISFDKNCRHRYQWDISDLDNKYKSSQYKMDHFGNLWEASADGITMFNGEELTTCFEGNIFYSLCFDHSNNLYASTLPKMEEQGIILKYDYFKWDTLVICSRNAKWVSCMHFDTADNLWFGVLSRWAVTPESGDGLYKYDGENFSNFNIWNSKLPCNSVVDITIDKYNSKWIGTYTGGSIKLNNNHEWKIFNKENTPMPFNSIEHILIDDTDNIWMAIQFYGLARLKE